MISFIKYFPFSLRDITGPCTLRGPTFSRAKETHLKAAGSFISLKAPRHNPSVPYAPGEAKPLGPLDHVEDRGGLRLYERTIMPCQSWRRSMPILRSWGYWGPWFTGCRIAVTMGVTIIGRDSEHPLPDVSFLHPRAFEGALADYLTALYGSKEKSTGKARYHGPVSWKPHTNLAVPAATFELYQVGLQGKLHSPSTFLCFPISKEHFVTIEFNVRKRAAVNENSDWIDSTEANELINDIIQSVDLDLNEESKKEIFSIKNNINDLNVTGTFKPLRWTS